MHVYEPKPLMFHACLWQNDIMQVCGQILYDSMHAYGQSLYDSIMHVLRPNPLMTPCMFGANPFCGIVHVLGSTCSHSIPTMLTRFACVGKTRFWVVR